MTLSLHGVPYNVVRIGAIIKISIFGNLGISLTTRNKKNKLNDFQNTTFTMQGLVGDYVNEFFSQWETSVKVTRNPYRGCKYRENK